ncbi:MAG TPA: LPS export ABC transporter permease LptF [Thermohalobaculum sp.]|nr:LPS export ABC transporter permease LptF [Thermohalobaculum sp.]
MLLDIRENRLRCLDRYILGLMAGPFLFFLLVFTGVIWLGMSLKVIDTVVNNGQPARVLLEFTLLLLPSVLTIVVPAAAFAATLYAVNRLLADSEIVVMFASGISGFRLVRPVIGFAVVLTAAMLVLTLEVTPTSQRELRTRISEVRGDVASAFLRAGTFQSPVRGVTVYLREMGRPGELLGIFVHDERDPGNIVTYTAKRAVILTDDDGIRLVMFDGAGQIADRSDPEALSVLRFEQFAYDLTQFTADNGQRRRKPSELYLSELLSITAAEAGGRTVGAYRAEAHEALSAPLYALALPLVAAALLIAARFRRQGFLSRILLTAAIGVALRLSGLVAKSAVSGAAALWPAIYLPPLLGIAAALWLLAGWPLPWRRRANGVAVPA